MLRLLCLFVGLVATVSAACQDPFRQVGEGCYYFSLEDDLTKTWAEARQYCQTMGTGVDLAVLDYLCDDYLNVANYLLMADAFLTLEDMYVGANGFDESWMWVDGRSLSVSSTHWHYQYPGSGAGCVYLYSYSSYSYGYERIQLYENACSGVRHFICQTNVNARH